MEKIIIGLISEVPEITFAELKKAADAFQKQVSRDFAPFWKKDARINPYRVINDIPKDTWPVTIRKNIGMPGALAFHDFKKRIPFSLVMYDPEWTISASHQILEMLACPFSNTMVAGRSIKPGEEKKKVNYLVQVCDPCLDISYKIDTISVSNFCTPHYYGAIKKKEAPYDFKGAIKQPLQVLKNGYISWLDPNSGKWWQLQYFGTKPRIVDLGETENEDKSVKKPRRRTNTGAGTPLSTQVMQDYKKQYETKEQNWKETTESYLSKYRAVPFKDKTNWSEYTPKTLDDLYQILNHVSDTQLFVFRGHASKNWEHLVTSLHRDLSAQATAAAQARLEADGITAFRRHGRSLLPYSELVYFDRILFGITLMQHYGAPSRLLDWSLSPWVAAYFVVSNESLAGDDGVIWAFNQAQLLKEYYKKLNSEKPEYRKFETLANADTVEGWLRASLEQTPVIKTFRYQYANTQMGAQQSIFTICGKINEYHEAALDRILTKKSDKLKIFIPSALKNSLRHRLFLMNVSALSLFPTVSGVGLHISEALRCGFPLGDDELLYQAEKKK
jgi:hypothetical protein